LSPLDQLKLRQAIVSNVHSAIAQQIQVMRVKFSAPAPKQNFMSQVASKIIPEKPKQLLHHSILADSNLLGGPTPKAIPTENISPLETLRTFSHPAQLKFLDNYHVNFGINDNADQVVQVFLDRLTDIFLQVKDVNARRNYLMNFLQSNLFKNYINTGLKALKHPELEPANVILNLLYQISPAYLNTRQFQYAAMISKHVRSICNL